MDTTAEKFKVLTANGLEGEVDLPTPPDGQTPRLVPVHFATGHTVWVAPEMLQRQAEGHYLLPLAIPPADTARAGETAVIPVIAEEAVVGKRQVDSGGVRVTKVVEERQGEVELMLAREAVEVERVPVGEFVDAPVEPEYDGDELVIPLYEEVVVIEKRLRLKEKLIVRRRRSEERWSAPVARRIEQAYVEPLRPGAAHHPSETGGDSA
jgi:uncharacterized protein (TIGR02271 family)